MLVESAKQVAMSVFQEDWCPFIDFTKIVDQSKRWSRVTVHLYLKVRLAVSGGMTKRQAAKHFNICSIRRQDSFMLCIERVIQDLSVGLTKLSVAIRPAKKATLATLTETPFLTDLQVDMYRLMTPNYGATLNRALWLLTDIQELPANYRSVVFLVGSSRVSHLSVSLALTS